MNRQEEPSRLYRSWFLTLSLIYRFRMPHTCLILSYWAGGLFLCVGWYPRGVMARTWPKQGLIAIASSPPSSSIPISPSSNYFPSAQNSYSSSTSSFSSTCTGSSIQQVIYCCSSTFHWIILFYSPPMDTQNLSSKDHLMPVTCEECPLYWLYSCRGMQAGQLKSFTLEKSSAVARYLLLFDRSTALTSLPSEQGGQIPRENQVSRAVIVAHCYPFKEETAVICPPLLVLKKRGSSEVARRAQPPIEKSMENILVADPLHSASFLRELTSQRCTRDMGGQQPIARRDPSGENFKEDNTCLSGFLYFLMSLRELNVEGSNNSTTPLPMPTPKIFVRLRSSALMPQFIFFFKAGFRLIISHFISSLSSPPVQNQGLFEDTANPHNSLSQCPSTRTVAMPLIISMIYPPLVPTKILPFCSLSAMILALLDFNGCSNLFTLNYFSLPISLPHRIILPYPSPDINPPSPLSHSALTSFRCSLYTFDAELPLHLTNNPLWEDVMMSSPTKAMLRAASNGTFPNIPFRHCILLPLITANLTSFWHTHTISVQLALNFMAQTTELGPLPNASSAFLPMSYTAMSCESLMEVAATNLPLLEMQTLAMDLSSCPANMYLDSSVIASQMMSAGLLPISPLTTRFLLILTSKQVMSSLCAVLTLTLFLPLCSTIPHPAVWYITYPVLLQLMLFLVSQLRYPYT